MEVFIILWVVYAIIFGGFCSFLASEKGHEGGAWFIMGFLFGIIALLVLIGVPAKTRSSNITSSSGTTSFPGQIDRSSPIAGTVVGESRKTRVCPFCYQEVNIFASVCAFCRRELPKAVRCAYRQCGRAIDPNGRQFSNDQGCWEKLLVKTVFSVVCFESSIFNNIF